MLALKAEELQGVIVCGVVMWRVNRKAAAADFVGALPLTLHANLHHMP